MVLLTEFINYIKGQHLFQKSDQLLLAVSGGVDSVVMTELCYRVGFSFAIAHCNFHLRGEESKRDEEFVRTLAGKYSVQVYVTSFDTEKFAERNKLSIQVAARDLRYTWFRELADQLAEDRKVANEKKFTGPVKILTAHHANDNIETLLMNFFKGTGIKGLQGILPKQGNLIRPLLFATKEAIVQYAQEYALTFVEDSSNQLDKYTRNYFRNQWIPSVQKVYPKVEENLANNLERFREIDILYEQAISLHLKKLVEWKGKEIHIPVLKLLKVTPLKTVVYEIIKDFGFTAHQTDEALKLLSSDTGKYISSPSHRIIRNRAWIIIVPLSTANAQHIIIEENDESIVFDQGVLLLKRNQVVPGSFVSSSANKILIDAESLRYPIILRKWIQGDYFYPFGMKKKSSGKPGKKKISKFFSDQKISLTEKESVWVLESDKRIVWIINNRMDDRFKITPQTRSCVSIEFIASERSH